MQGLRSSRRSGSIRRPTRERLEGEEGWLALALGVATGIALIDGIAGSTYVLVGFLALPPIVASATTASRPTTVVAAYCLLLALASMFWHSNLSGQYVIWIVGVALAGGLSAWNAMLREELSAGARGGAVLGGLSRRNDAPQEEVGTAERIVEAAVPDLASVAILDLVDSDGAIGAAAVATSDPGLTKRLRRIREGVRINPGGQVPVAEVIRTGERRLYRQMGDAEHRANAVDERHLELLREVRLRSLLIVPLSERGETIGALSLGSLESDDRYGSAEVAFAEELAKRAAAGINNARLHDRQARLSRTLQANLLPPALPRVKGLEIAAGFRPAAGPEEQIGGDFYDVFQRGESSWKAVIGDVCGKGPKAAALTSLMRDTLRASALRGETPSESLTLLNAAILEAGTDRRFCTSAVVRLDLGSPTVLTVSNGGHPPPLLLRKGGVVEEIGPPGTLLGVYDDPELVDTTAELRKGDSVMLYTDGLFEVPPEQGAEVLSVKDLLAQCKGMSAAKTAAAIEARVLEAQGGDPHDDIAILVLRRT